MVIVNDEVEIGKTPVDNLLLLHHHHHLKIDPVVPEAHETHSWGLGVGPACVDVSRPTYTLGQEEDLHCHQHHPEGRTDPVSANGNATES
jgi:hypothetical protein